MDDIQFLCQRGLSVQDVERQQERIKRGVSYVRLSRPAKIGDGIMEISKESGVKYSYLYKTKSLDMHVIKFVPASGAATRMFKYLFRFVESFDPSRESFEQYSSNDKEIEKFFLMLEKFAFYPALKRYMNRVPQEFEGLSEDEKKLKIAQRLLFNPFNFGKMPKGLFPFHMNRNKAVTAFEEHFRESTFYAAPNGTANLHFTISAEHDSLFLRELANIKPALEKRYKVNFDVSFSFQKPSTDTISLTEDGELLRDEKGEIVFRPSGHGALLKNLNEMYADIIFIKNIDNVVSNSFLDQTTFYKEVLAGKLEEVRSRCHSILYKIEKGEIKAEEVNEVLAFLKSINVHIPEGVKRLSAEELREFLHKSLNRPIRVCGMVKNEGDPGGGPFWVIGEDGSESLQIVESSQIDLLDTEQKDIFTSSTHFNPVDIVCCIKDYMGNIFDLDEFANHDLGFVCEKTYMGKKIKTIERAGLWNGSMEGWITVLMEVPQITFNPVKTVNDLLKETHLK